MPRRAFLSSLVAVPLVAGAVLAGLLLLRNDASTLRYTVPATAEGDTTLRLRLRDDVLELVDARAGLVVARRPLHATSGVSVQGGRATRDTLVVDFSGGRFALPDGLRYDGGVGAYDTLVIRGGAGSGAVHDPAVGRVRIGGVDIRYSNLEPVVDTVPEATFTVNATDGPNTITLDNGTANGDGRLRVTIDAFEPIEFANKTNLVIDAGDGVAGGDTDDTIILRNTEASTGLGTVTVHGREGDDTINVLSTPSGVTTTVNGGTESDAIVVGSEAPSTLDAILGPLNLNGEAHSAGGVATITAVCDQTVEENLTDTGDSAVLDDSGDATPKTYDVSATTVQRTGAATITYGTLEYLRLDATNFGDTVNVSTTAPSIMTEIFGGGGVDTFNVTTTGTAANANLFGGPGGDFFTLQTTGANSGTFVGGSADDDTIDLMNTGASSAVFIQGDVGTDVITVSASATGSVVQIDSGPETDTIVVAPSQQGTVCHDQMPTAALVRAVGAARTVKGVAVRWRTAHEAGLLGFDVYRERGATRVRVNRRLVASAGAAAGRAYAYVDVAAPRGRTLRYWVAAVRLNGSRSWFGPATVRG